MAKKKNYGAPSDRLVTFLVFGLIAQAIGAALVVPEVASDDEADLTLALTGFVALGLGGLLTLIGAVGWGVLVALRVRDEERTPNAIR